MSKTRYCLSRLAGVAAEKASC